MQASVPGLMAEARLPSKLISLLAAARVTDHRTIIAQWDTSNLSQDRKHEPFASCAYWLITHAADEESKAFLETYVFPPLKPTSSISALLYDTFAIASLHRDIGILLRSTTLKEKPTSRLFPSLLKLSTSAALSEQRDPKHRRLRDSPFCLCLADAKLKYYRDSLHVLHLQSSVLSTFEARKGMNLGGPSRKPPVEIRENIDRMSIPVLFHVKILIAWRIITNVTVELPKLYCTYLQKSEY
ncbi:uncharacterized protein BDR25DRAFT_394508 [Lindgomyces ingoldianus]|uniref:Uncharacterized protein n=1 Tax=Lindgomyces ingoldianus TaxID=673940 RepID=A0ACB6QQ71_9PLEO|nr:uncharacterized protein BDR25DRAFT_394508 [Lindgomyces ingoldianus]KAF2469143.1 hypothetical protein BDR25DRAFT_394508 [Lindgomyces ingoldianus]